MINVIVVYAGRKILADGKLGFAVSFQNDETKLTPPKVFGGKHPFTVVGGLYEVEMSEDLTSIKPFTARYTGESVSEALRVELVTTDRATAAEYDYQRSHTRAARHQAYFNLLAPVRVAYNKATPIGRRQIELDLLAALRNSRF